MRQPSTQEALDTLALATMPVPVVGDVAGLASDAYRFATDPESRTLGNAAWASLGMLPFVPYMGAIKAYHGSPHTFDKFDMSKIGTGEGAQAYGHGLYFAESPRVAQEYKDKLTDLRTGSANRALTNAGGDIDAAIADARAKIDRLMGLPDGGGDIARRDRQVSIQEEKIAELMALKESGQMSRGSLYTVDLDVEPDDLLDWDAPLSQQSEKVRKALGDAVDDGRGNHPTHGPISQWINSSEITGGDIYDSWGMNKPLLSEKLRRAGIPGLRYLDAGSRESGEGTRNFVLFDDTLAKILERNGQPVK